MESVSPKLSELARAEDQTLYELSRGYGRGRLALGEAFERFAEQEGPGALGLSNRDGYAKERLSRSGRWVGEAARLARRLEGLPRIAAAYRAGELSWSMAELLARRASAEDEAEILSFALLPGVTVHTMREVLACGADDDETADPQGERCTVSETIPAEEALLVEATRLLCEHIEGSDHDWFACVVADAMSGRPELWSGEWLPEVPLDLDEVRARVAEGIARRREAEERAEPELPVNEPERGDFPAPEALPSDPRELDAVMQRTAMFLASRDLVFGRAARDFFRSARWRELGYATDTQYCRERLGMSRSAVRDRIYLARRCESLRRLAEAVSTMEIGFEAAKQIARVATPSTEEAWIERATRRTFKHLREEVRMVEAHRRLTGESGAALPPTDDEMADREDFERSVLSGELVGALIGREREPEAEIRIEEVCEPGEDAAESGSPRSRTELGELTDRVAAAIDAGRLRRKGEVKLRIRAHREDACLYRAARERHRRLGAPNSLLAAMCIGFWETWLEDLRQERTVWDAVHARDRHRCASPGCSRRLCTLHHIVMRMLGGDDRWENLLTLCDTCHLRNIHERGSLAVSGEAPDRLTFVFGREPVFVVRGREKRPAAA